MPAATVDRKREALEKLRAATLAQLQKKSPEEVALAEERYKQRNRILYDFPDAGPLSRDKYPRHMEFFAAGKEHDERAFIAANRIGKSRAAACEMAWHMTGLYPKWWKGRRFAKAGMWWTANESWKSVRDVNQLELIGPPDQEDKWGTGSIPAHLIHKTNLNPHIKFGLESFQVKHVTGGISTCHMKSYEQGWKEFEGRRIDGAWLDEQCPLDIYNAVQLRTMATDGTSKKNGIIILTFTPLLGITELLKNLRERAVNGDELAW